MFERRLREGRPIVADGGMGVVLSAAVPGLRVPEEANLRAPDAVVSVHVSLINAVAELIAKNPSGANRRKLEQPYLEGLRSVAEGRGERDHVLVLFLGSTIGNFDRDAGEDFLHQVRATLRLGDGLLLGTDLEKPVEQQILAYDDPAGVTAAFNLNLLARINRELGADFDLSCFRHEARWNYADRRIEMHLRSTCRQSVRIPAANLRVVLDEDETIWTESSHKYKAEEIPEMAVRAGFRCDAQWIDAEWPFAQNLLIAE